MAPPALHSGMPLIAPWRNHEVVLEPNFWEGIRCCLMQNAKTPQYMQVQGEESRGNWSIWLLPSEDEVGSNAAGVKHGFSTGCQKPWLGVNNLWPHSLLSMQRTPRQASSSIRGACRAIKRPGKQMRLYKEAKHAQRMQHLNSIVKIDAN